MRTRITTIDVVHEAGDGRLGHVLAEIALLSDEPSSLTAPGSCHAPDRPSVPEVLAGVAAKTAARYLRGMSRKDPGVDDQTVRRYIRDGQLRALRRSRRDYLVPLGQLDPDGSPPPRLDQIIGPEGPLEDARHAAETLAWFVSAELGRDGATPVELLHRGHDQDIELVWRTAQALRGSRGSLPSTDL